MLIKPNLIVIGSTGRNTGKTEFACRLIKQYSATHKVIGVKVVAIERNEAESCPRGGKGCGVCSSLKNDYEIFEETIIDPNKDTSRMLMAGAHKVFFLKVDKNSLEKGLNALLELIPDNAMVICESNSIRKALEPGLFLVIKNLEDKTVKDSCAEVIKFANKIIEFNNMSWDFNPDRILIKDNQWIIREKATAIILAGGKSSRMGEDKYLLPVNGKPLIQYIIDQLHGHFDEIIIGANEPERFAFTNLKVVPDNEREKGPLMGIYSCIQASSNDANFVTACDIPDMSIKLIKNMINLSVDFDIVMPVTCSDNHEPLYAVYRKSILPYADQILANNGRRIIELLNYSKVKLIDFKDQGWYQNLNIKADYSEFIKKFNEKKCFRE
jgi:molybdopterin-guanine dinucleotide biosynthesis protein A